MHISVEQTHSAHYLVHALDLQTLIIVNFSWIYLSQELESAAMQL